MKNWWVIALVAIFLIFIIVDGILYSGDHIHSVKLWLDKLMADAHDNFVDVVD